MVQQEDANLDPRDDAMLRATLECMVEEERSSLRLDLSEWSLVVHNLGGGMVQARLGVTGAGASTVKR
jgi:hypothetical protein